MGQNLNVIVEDKIPFIKGALEGVANVVYLPSEEITPQAMADVDALITRTRTRCDASLLDGSKCQFIATATIGLDHIDRQYCSSRGIEVANAPGCNAPAVAQWVLATALRLVDKHPSELTLGIVGVGNVGKIVEDWARQIGFKVLLCDPPRALAEGGEVFVDLAHIAAHSDIITFHTPLTRDGEYRTWHLADERFFAQCLRKPLLLNAARGPVVDTAALVAALRSGVVGKAAIDTWEGEPDNISRELLKLASIATPHIAGYSLQGKVRATAMVLDAFTRHFNLPKIDPVGIMPRPRAQMVTLESVVDSYDPRLDDLLLRHSPSTFEHQRDFYMLRPEVE